jgi:predicted nucleic acid-binding protein
VKKLFLDANILFSVAWRENSGLLRLGKLTKAKLLTSGYAVEEARRNLENDEQRQRLAAFLLKIEILPDCPDQILPVKLAEKDRPILQAAIGHRADFLITGDRQHFGAFYGKNIGGVQIFLPSEILKKLE